MSKVKIIGGLTGVALLAATIIMPSEGLRHLAYLDPPGIPKICYGHTSGVQLGQVKTDSDCQALLAADIKIVDEALTKLVKVPMSENRRAAFISFVFNIGQGNFAHSTALKKLNAGDGIGACREMLRWVYSGGQLLPGLVRRRNAERELCLS